MKKKNSAKRVVVKSQQVHILNWDPVLKLTTLVPYKKVVFSFFTFPDKAMVVLKRMEASKKALFS